MYGPITDILFSQGLNGKITFDFKNPDGLRLLTTILLKKDFNLEIDLPANKLIPTIPLRLNYLLWLEDLFNLNYDSTKKIKGIDIGNNYDKKKRKKCNKIIKLSLWSII